MTKITLPIYYQQSKLKSFLVGLNWYRNAHYQISNNTKKHYHSLIYDELIDSGIKLDEYEVLYKLYYKNKSCDMMNVVSVIDKFLNDSLQDLGLIKNDNVQYYTRCISEVAEQDRVNPRIEITISEKELSIEEVMYDAGDV